MRVDTTWSDCVQIIKEAHAAGNAAQWTIGKAVVRALDAGKPDFIGTAVELVGELADDVGLDHTTVDSYRRVEAFYTTAIETPPRGGLAAFAFTAYRDIAGRFPNDAAGAVAFLERLLEREPEPPWTTWTRKAVLLELDLERPRSRVAPGQDADGDPALDDAGDDDGARGDLDHEARTPAERAARVAELLADPETQAAVVADKAASELVEVTASAVHRALENRVYAQHRARIDRDAAEHILARLGTIHSELDRFCDAVAKIAVEPAVREKLVHKADLVEGAADWLLTILRDGVATDKALASLLQGRSPEGGVDDEDDVAR